MNWIAAKACLGQQFRRTRFDYCIASQGAVSRYLVAPLAQSDFAEVLDYITVQNPNAAERIRVTIMDAVERLADEPGIGHARPDLTSQPVRSWTVSGRYTIVYREAAAMIEIVRVFGPGRDVARLLS